MKNIYNWILGLVIILGVYNYIGIFVIQPIGAIPDGATIVYLRTEVNAPFLSSADSISLERTGSVSIMSRALVLASMSRSIVEKKIIKLPYFEFLFDWTISRAESNYRSSRY